jgi:hypothetical protein
MQPGAEPLDPPLTAVAPERSGSHLRQSQQEEDQLAQVESVRRSSSCRTWAFSTGI